ncbi:MAG: 30S ribosomal protein S8 [Chitinivibrionales bacterium]|nr:30S ribosomal protein S8 [Chitinivibrionales bacterium]MBD3397219.1 30S ribosomal protein S8 [Chitinivibrionales bacterium]
MPTDPIADMFTRIRNAIQARKKTVDIPASKLKREVTRILHENHFIRKYAFTDDGKQGTIKILLKYDGQMRSAIQGIQRVSTPGLRTYRGAATIPRVLNGLGIAIVSTSRGVLTDHQCRKNNAGGEVIGKVW